MLHDKLGLRCVVDNHTLDGNLLKEGWEPLSKAAKKQRDWTRARREGRAAMVERIVQRALRQRVPKR